MNIKAKTRKLSDVPSEMLMQALEDLEQVLKDPYYRINMRTWYTPVSLESELPPVIYCEVCHAGAVIAKSLGNGDRIKSPASFPSGIADKLEAIDAFRKGQFHNAFFKLRLPDPDFLPPTLHDTLSESVYESIVFNSHEIAKNRTARTLYFNYFQDLIGILQAEGL